MHIHFQLAQQCIQISTRINSSSVHTYIFVCFTLRVILQGFVTQNATWCQNRGCICISSTGRTYGRIHIPATIILWTELFPKKRREKISKERFFNLSSSTVVFSTNNTRTTRFLRIQCILQCFHTQSSNSK